MAGRLADLMRRHFPMEEKLSPGGAIGRRTGRLAIAAAGSTMSGGRSISWIASADVEMLRKRAAGSARPTMSRSSPASRSDAALVRL